MHLKGFNDSSWKGLLQQARAQVRKTFPGKILATDRSPEAIAAAKQNAANAGAGHLIEFDVCDFAETRIPDGGGVVILNPEYGERLGKLSQLSETYKRIGDFFKKKCVGYRGYIFTGNLDLAKKVGLKARRRIPFFNSNIECRLLEYDLYAGSKEAERSPEQAGKKRTHHELRP
jgi:putative N6-adenine-specific DNA methylase